MTIYRCNFCPGTKVAEINHWYYTTYLTLRSRCSIRTEAEIMTGRIRKMHQPKESIENMRPILVNKK